MVSLFQSGSLAYCGTTIRPRERILQSRLVEAACSSIRLNNGSAILQWQRHTKTRQSPTKMRQCWFYTRSHKGVRTPKHCPNCSLSVLKVLDIVVSSRRRRASRRLPAASNRSPLPRQFWKFWPCGLGGGGYTLRRHSWSGRRHYRKRPVRRSLGEGGTVHGE